MLEEFHAHPAQAASLAELPALCHLVLAAAAVVFALSWLRGVLVPLTLAVGLAQLFQPVLVIVVQLPNKTRGCLRRSCHRCHAHPPDCLVGEQQGLPGLLESERIEAAVAEASLQLEGAEVQDDANMQLPSRDLRWRFQACLQGMWDIIAIMLCTSLLIGVLSTFVWAVVTALEKFDFTKYKDSSKLKAIFAWLKSQGITFKTDGQYVWDHFEAQLLGVATDLLSFSEGMVLTLLMFFFCLYALIPGAREGGGRSGVARLVQQYLLMKTLASLVIAAAVGLALHLLRVDLAALFALMTFTLNFIPNLGSAIAMLAPLPLVLLDPSKTISEAVLCVVIPFAIHNTLGCIMEPKLMSHGTLLGICLSRSGRAAIAEP